MNKILSKENCLNHYKWGNNCDGWDFVADSGASIKQELMPARTAEKFHYHTKAKQFFYILKGTATFIIESKTLEVHANQGLEIKAMEKHKIINQTDADLEFILFSHPSTQNDRTDCE